MNAEIQMSPTIQYIASQGSFIQESIIHTSEDDDMMMMILMMMIWYDMTCKGLEDK